MDRASHEGAGTMIGIIDSGFGGLSIYQSLNTLLPSESTIYIGDHAYIPYGEKSKKQIQQRVKKLILFLQKNAVTLIVVACNTATVAGIDVYRKWFPTIPIVGVVPVIKTAVEQTKTKQICILSTPFTATSAYQKELIRQFGDGCVVYNVGCPNLVSYVEKGILTGPDIEKELRTILVSVKRNNVDVIALGCTHYPFLKDQIRAIVGEDVTILDSGGAVARQVARIIKHNHMKTIGATRHIFYSTQRSPNVSTIASLLLKKEVSIDYANI